MFRFFYRCWRPGSDGQHLEAQASEQASTGLFDPAPEPAPEVVGRPVRERGAGSSARTYNVIKTVLVQTKDRRWWKAADVTDERQVVNVQQVRGVPPVGAYNFALVNALLEGRDSVSYADITGNVVHRFTHEHDECVWVKQTSARGQRYLLYFIRTHTEEPRGLPFDTFKAEFDPPQEVTNSPDYFGIDVTRRGVEGAMFDASEFCPVCYETYEDVRYLCLAACGIHKGCSDCFDRCVQSSGIKWCPLCKKEGETQHVYNQENATKSGRH